MLMQEGEVLSADQAMRSLYGRLPEIKRWIVLTIVKMAMPPAPCLGSTSPVESLPVDARTPSASAVRRALQGDEDLVAMIELEVIESFQRRVASRPIRSEEIAPYLYRTTQWATRRRARHRAKERLARVQFEIEGVQLDGEALAVLEPLPDAIVDSRQMRARLGAVLVRLTPVELKLLDASETRSYEAVAAELGIKLQTAKNRACDLRKRIREALLD